MKKGCGIVLLVFGFLNLFVAFIAMGYGAPSEVVFNKIAAFCLLVFIGFILLYFSRKD